MQSYSELLDEIEKKNKFLKQEVECHFMSKVLHQIEKDYEPKRYTTDELFEKFFEVSTTGEYDHLKEQTLTECISNILNNDPAKSFLEEIENKNVRLSTRLSLRDFLTKKCPLSTVEYIKKPDIPIRLLST